MARVGIFKTPSEIKNEDRWFRYFNRRQAVILAIMLIIDYRIILVSHVHGWLLPAIIIAICLTMLVMGIVMINLPVDRFFLTGGGLQLDEFIYRLIYRKVHRTICTKNYNQDVDL